MTVRQNTNLDDDIISGDLCDGIVVMRFVDREYQVRRNGTTGKIAQKTISSQDDRMTVQFHFQIDRPIRLQLEFFVPENCANARVTLQDKTIIGYFSPDIPEDLRVSEERPCDESIPISTLCPGKFQSVNFLWKPGDLLEFHCLF